MKEYKVYCHWCGLNSVEKVEACDEKAAKEVFFQNHKPINPERTICPATRGDLTVEKI
jgi:hypothetical protein